MVNLAPAGVCVPLKALFLVSIIQSGGSHGFIRHQIWPPCTEMLQVKVMFCPVFCLLWHVFA